MQLGRIAPQLEIKTCKYEHVQRGMIDDLMRQCIYLPAGVTVFVTSQAPLLIYCRRTRSSIGFSSGVACGGDEGGDNK